MVIDNCAWRENCGGGPDLSYLYLVAFFVLVVALFVTLLVGKRESKIDAANGLVIIAKLIVAFFGIPALVFVLMGGRDGGGGPAAVIAFYGVMLVFVMVKPIGEWIMTGFFRYDDEDL